VAGRTVNIEMTDDKVAAIVQSLWHPLEDGTIPNVFMVLDCARDKRIEPLINKSNIEQSCLYSGKLAYKLKRAAPHIVKLSPTCVFTTNILALCWGKSWGVFFLTASSTKMSTVRTNCRRLGKVKGVDGKSLVFRYYDPRVLRLMLPACNRDEITSLLGESKALLIETENDFGVTIFERGNQNSPVLINNASFTEKTSSLLTVDENENLNVPLRNFFQLRQAHMDALLQKITNEEFASIKADYIKFYMEESPTQFAINQQRADKQVLFDIGGKSVDLDSFLRLCFKNAQALELTSRDSVLTFIHMNHQYGWLFWENEEHQWAADILHSNRPEEAKIEAIIKQFSRILMNRMWS